ncbi:MAG: hypothetical protein HY873_10810 [Chloroflexi bacterium]|nr:hypothetical protein [Chloroflexota bacterium]
MNEPESRAEQLYDEGAASLAARWDDDVAMVRYPERPELHDPRATLAYAGTLLREGGGGNTERASRAIRAVLALQETREQDAHRGNFRWMLEEEGVRDLNGVEFMLDGLNYLIREYAGVIPDDVASEMRAAIALGLAEIDRLDVHPGYTNIALSDICNSVLGGETLGEDEYVDRGASRLDEWFEFTNRSGAPHEFNSPTYLAVDIARMAFLAEQTADPDIALKARVAKERLWLHAATHYHPGLAQLAGPHSRSYFDGWTGAGGYLKLMLWRLLGDEALRRETSYAARSREEGHTGVALEAMHCPAYIERWLREKRYPFWCAETTDVERELDIATYMTDSYAVGTASRSYAVGEPVEQWESPNSVLLQFRREAAPGYGTLFARYVIDDRGHGAGHASPREAEDWTDDGTFVGAQHRNRAIVAYGLRPRLRPTRSYKLSVNMLGAAGAEIRVGGAPVDASTHGAIAVHAGEAVCIAVGDVYVAIMPLEPSDMGSDAPIELHLDGEKLTLDIYNYRGFAKQFWEHRTQAGPFYKGNVRSAFVLEVAERREYADIDVFAGHIADAMLADSANDEYVREIAYASGTASMALRYSLWDMTPVERRFDGAGYEAPMGRAGALDGTGPQFLQSWESLITLGRARLLAGTTPKWLVADDGARHYVFVNPSDEQAPVWLETPDSVVECDAFGFGRVELDDATGAVAIEATGEIGTVRVRRDGEITLTINGVDVTGSLLRTTEPNVREFRGF